ncbi:MAG: hypothetical protein H6772_04545 [Pseudomonadales bacterium]|nr:hypothetical protein [Pseudomonadales bacterium]
MGHDNIKHFLSEHHKMQQAVGFILFAFILITTSSCDTPRQVDQDIPNNPASLVEDPEAITNQSGGIPPVAAREAPTSEAPSGSTPPEQPEASSGSTPPEPPMTTITDSDFLEAAIEEGATPESNIEFVDNGNTVAFFNVGDETIVLTKTPENEIVSTRIPLQEAIDWAEKHQAKIVTALVVRSNKGTTYVYGTNDNGELIIGKQVTPEPTNHEWFLSESDGTPAPTTTTTSEAEATQDTTVETNEAEATEDTMALVAEEIEAKRYDTVEEALLGETEIASFIGHEGEGTLLGDEFGPHHEMYFTKEFSEQVIGTLGTLELTRPDSVELFNKYLAEIFLARILDINPNVTREEVENSLSGDGDTLSYLMPVLDLKTNGYLEIPFNLGPELKIISIFDVVPGSEARWFNATLTDGTEVRLVLPYIIGSDDNKSGVGIFIDPAKPNIIYHIVQVGEGMVEVDSNNIGAGNVLNTIFFAGTQIFGLDFETQREHTQSAARDAAYRTMFSSTRFDRAKQSLGEGYNYPSAPIEFTKVIAAYPEFFEE